MGWIFVAIAGFFGYQYLSDSPTVTAGVQTIKSVAGNLEAITNKAKEIAGAGMTETDRLTEMLPPDVRFQLQQASQQAATTLPALSDPRPGCGTPDSTGNIKYCFNQ